MGWGVEGGGGDSESALTAFSTDYINQRHHSEQSEPHVAETMNT